MSNVNFTRREYEEIPQKTIEIILKLFKSGMSPEAISETLDISPEEVKQVFSQTNADVIASEIIRRFDTKSKELRCSISGRLMRKPVQGPENKLFDKQNLKRKMKSEQLDSSSMNPLPDIEADIQRLSKETLSAITPLLTKVDDPNELAEVVAECLSVLRLEIDLELFLIIFVMDNHTFLYRLITSLCGMVSTSKQQDLIKECSGSESHQLASIILFEYNLMLHDEEFLEEHFDHLLRILSHSELKKTTLSYFKEIAEYHLTKDQLILCLEALFTSSCENTEEIISYLIMKIEEIEVKEKRDTDQREDKIESTKRQIEDAGESDLSR